MDKVQFTIDAEPVPAARPRVTSRGHAFYPKKHTAYAEFLRGVFKSTPQLLHSGPVAVLVKFVMPRYKTSNHPVHRADVDNLSKLPMDSMTKAEADKGGPRYWEDDSMVVHLGAFKRFVRDGEKPHTKVKLTPITGNVEDYIDGAFENG